MTSADTRHAMFAAEERMCRPCRKNWPVARLADPRRCPQCGGPVTSAAQIEQQHAETDSALKELVTRSAWIMRLTSLSMVSVQIMTYFFEDQQAASFFNDVVTTSAAVASIVTEVWAFTGARIWMVLASLSLQAAAILFFFVAAAFLTHFMPSRLALLVAVLPLAGSLMAWHEFRAYSQILRLHRKAR